jgi:hypothetical protein
VTTIGSILAKLARESKSFKDPDLTFRVITASTTKPSDDQKPDLKHLNITLYFVLASSRYGIHFGGHGDTMFHTPLEGALTDG